MTAIFMASPFARSLRRRPSGLFLLPDAAFRAGTQAGDVAAMRPHHRQRRDGAACPGQPVPQKKYSAKNGHAAAAAIDPTDTCFVATTSTAKMSSSRHAPTQPNVTNRQPTATAMPLPPLNLSHGLKMWPQVQPRNATASMVS